MLTILQARLQQHVNCELPDVQAGFSKGGGNRHQIANILWIIGKDSDAGRDWGQGEKGTTEDKIAGWWRILSITLLACEMSAIVR